MKKIKIISKRPNKYVLKYGKSLNEITKIFGVSKATIINWQKNEEKREWMEQKLRENN